MKQELEHPSYQKYCASYHLHQSKQVTIFRLLRRHNRLHNHLFNKLKTLMTATVELINDNQTFVERVFNIQHVQKEKLI